VIWSNFPPYNRARLRQLARYCVDHQMRLTAIEVVGQDPSPGPETGQWNNESERICCFPGKDYQLLTARTVHGRVRRLLEELRPDVVFAPATPFPEGMAAVAYRNHSGCRLFMMDDAWEQTDRRARFIRSAKRMIHRSIDGVFVPAESHAGYFRSLGFPDDRIVFGVDVVDNEYFAEGARRARAAAAETRAVRDLPVSYFLFAGRLLPRKGLTTLLDAYDAYRRATPHGTWSLVIVGSGPGEETLRRRAAGYSEVHVMGRKSGGELLDCFGLAGALVVPSEWDPWSLVVNEGMASGLPVIVSRGCGCASVLVEEGSNGWTFESGDVRQLAEILGRASRMPADALAQMGSRSSEIIARWSLDRFVAGVVDALAIPRREKPDPASRVAARLWKGRISIK